MAIEQEADKIEEEHEKEVLDWIEEEERKEQEMLAAKQNSQNQTLQEDEEWMLQKLKEEYGEDFGDDINDNFEGS